MPLKFNGIFFKLLPLQYQKGNFNYTLIPARQIILKPIAFIIFFFIFCIPNRNY
jgi:hypothetical protein